MKHCIKCNDVMEHLSNSMLRKIKKAATEFKHSDKEEMHKMKISALQFSNKKNCEYCYLEDLAYLTTMMRIKAMQQKNPCLRIPFL
ncbi:hypothetical protein BLX06_11715 [Bacillus cereus]|uniref:Uncharacterized protein n=1 Tax=Bacillus cereus TaxID=1396 RepID=A0A9X6B9R4_BACCE|nr:hypothetical protein BLX06_11715 [Bacillus cereus]